MHNLKKRAGNNAFFWESHLNENIYAAYVGTICVVISFATAAVFNLAISLSVNFILVQPKILSFLGRPVVIVWKIHPDSAVGEPCRHRKGHQDIVDNLSHYFSYGISTASELH